MIRSDCACLLSACDSDKAPAYCCVSVDNVSRPYIQMYIPLSTDYINAVFSDVSLLPLSPTPH